MTRRLRLVGAGLAVSLLAAGGFFLFEDEWGPPSPPERPPLGAAPRTDPRPPLDPLPCPFEIPGRVVECFRVRAPRADSARHTVELFVTRVHGKSRTATRPLLFIGGGPGQSLSEDLAERLGEQFPLGAHTGDFVFVDPRGTGRSRPLLTCRAEKDNATSIAACHRAVSVEADPADFGTPRVARDLDLVRRALGYASWDVLAASYGTRVGLTLVRDFPGTVRALVLDSPVPLEVDLLAALGPNVARALERIFADCRASTACRDEFDDPEATLRAILERAAREGRALDARALVEGLFGLLYLDQAARFVPYVVKRAEAGDSELLRALQAASTRRPYALGAHLSTQCAEELPFTTRADVQQAEEHSPDWLRFALPSGLSYFDDCALWPVSAAPKRENEPVTSQVPTLVLSGSWDPVTPPDYAARVLGQLPRARLVELDFVGHGASFSSCGFEAVQAFLAAPEAPVAPSCVSATSERRWVGREREPKFELAAPDATRIGELAFRLVHRL